MASWLHSGLRDVPSHSMTYIVMSRMTPFGLEVCVQCETKRNGERATATIKREARGGFFQLGGKEDPKCTIYLPGEMRVGREANCFPARRLLAARGLNHHRLPPTLTEIDIDVMLNSLILLLTA